MPRNRNPVIDADLDDDSFNDPTEAAEEAEEFEPEFGSDDEFTTEDVQEQVRTMSDRQMGQLNKTRRQGQAAPSGPKRARTTKAQAVQRARAPVRAREVEWKPVDTLDAPPPMPGMEGRWVRFRLGSEDDQKNFSAKQRGGWVPRKVSTVPQGYFPPTMRHSQLGEIIAVGDLIYCERPRSIGLAQKRYFKEKLRRQTLAGQRHIRKVERGDHPIDVQNRRERPTVGYGQKRRVTVQDDE